MKIPISFTRLNKYIKNQQLSNTDYDFHKLSIDQLESQFKVNHKTGLTNDQARHLLKKHGENRIKTSNLGLYISVLRGLFYGFPSLIWIAAILSLISYSPLSQKEGNLPNLVQGILLIVIILTQAVLVLIRDWNTLKVLKNIERIADEKAYVLREGKK